MSVPNKWHAFNLNAQWQSKLQYTLVNLEMFIVRNVELKGTTVNFYSAALNNNNYVLCNWFGLSI